MNLSLHTRNSSSSQGGGRSGSRMLCSGLSRSLKMQTLYQLPPTLWPQQPSDQAPGYSAQHWCDDSSLAVHCLRQRALGVPHLQTPGRCGIVTCVPSVTCVMDLCVVHGIFGEMLAPHISVLIQLLKTEAGNTSGVHTCTTWWPGPGDRTSLAVTLDHLELL